MINKMINMLPVSDESFNECDKRVVVSREEPIEWCRDNNEYPFVLFSNNNQLRGDKNAESPFEENDDGDMVVREGVVVFPVSIYEHSGISYHLGDYHGVDAEWDSVNEAFFLWTDKEHWDNFFGEGEFENTEKSDFINEAEGEIRDLNLESEGSCYGWRLEEKRKFTKMYETGEMVDGFEWEFIDGCGGYLTDNVNDLDLPTDVPVFFEKDVYLLNN